MSRIVGLEHGADHHPVVVDEGNRPIAGSGESAQSLDLRGGTSPTWPDSFMWSRSRSNSTLRSRPRSFNERSVSARSRSGRLVLSPTKVELWSWNQRITSSTPGQGRSVAGTCSGDEGCCRC
jgi:hypothetical protein